jgi:hypothetical protein
LDDDGDRAEHGRPAPRPVGLRRINWGELLAARQLARAPASPAAARAASGHVIAAPPKMMRSRRLMGLTRGQGSQPSIAGLGCVSGVQKARPHVRLGLNSVVPVISAARPLFHRKRKSIRDLSMSQACQQRTHAPQQNSMPEQTHPLILFCSFMAWPVFRFVCWPIDYRALFHSE